MYSSCKAFYIAIEKGLFWYWIILGQVLLSICLHKSTEGNGVTPLHVGVRSEASSVSLTLSDRLFDPFHSFFTLSAFQGQRPCPNLKQIITQRLYFKDIGSLFLFFFLNNGWFNIYNLFLCVSLITTFKWSWLGLGGTHVSGRRDPISFTLVSVASSSSSSACFCPWSHPLKSWQMWNLSYSWASKHPIAVGIQNGSDHL